MQKKLELINKYLEGKGIEFGALNQPLALNKDAETSVMYADKYFKAGLSYTFPELGESEIAKIVTTDIILDLDFDEYNTLKKYKFDFYIASHVIEHLVNPLLFLKKLSKVMKPESLLYFAVPDKNYSFDRHRPLTTWNHLYWEYLFRVKTLSNAHLKEFLFATSKSPYRLKSRYRNKWFRDKIYEYHTDRSIHVHVWDDASFKEFLEKANLKLNLKFKVLEYLFSNKETGEAVYILKKVQ